MSQCRIGSGSPSRPIPPIVTPFQAPDRLSQKMLLNRSGSLYRAWLAGRVAWSNALLAVSDRPDGAGRPLLVAAVAVVRLFITVLLKNRTSVESSTATPPPSSADTLLTMKLL